MACTYTVSYTHLDVYKRQAEAAVGLAILVVYFRNRGTIAVEDLNIMKG